MTNGNGIAYNSTSSTISGMIKSDGTASSVKNGADTGLMKTVLGEIIVSINSEIMNPEMQDIIMKCIALASGAFSSLANLRGSFFASKFLVFITPEAIDLEIELQTLSKEIDTLPLHSESSSASTYSVMEGAVSPSKVPVSDMSFLIDNCIGSSQTFPSRIPSESHSILASFMQQTSAAPASRISKTTDTQEKSVRGQQRSDHVSISSKAGSEEKTCDISKSDLNQDDSKDGENNREEQNSQDDSSQDQESQNRDETNDKNSERVTSKKEKISLNYLTISDFQYLKPVKPVETNRQTPVNKIFSPLKLFSSMEKSKFLPQKSEEDDKANVFIKFMRLMARILGQAEAEAHELYLKIKQRTDNVDILTLLTSKVNSEKGDIDWKNDEEMKLLIEKAREIEVDIPENKYSWNEDEKKLLKENIQMRKDSLEKITQLERTDMQRYLQEASQCHQARSNILKLLKEVIDTFVYNIRP